MSKSNDPTSGTHFSLRSDRSGGGILQQEVHGLPGEAGGEGGVPFEQRIQHADTQTRSGLTPLFANTERAPCQ